MIPLRVYLSVRFLYNGIIGRILSSVMTPDSSNIELGSRHFHFLHMLVPALEDSRHASMLCLVSLSTFEGGFPVRFSLNDTTSPSAFKASS